MSLYICVLLLVGVTTSALVGWAFLKLFSLDRSGLQTSMTGWWRFFWPVVHPLSLWLEPTLSWSQRSYLVRQAYQARLPTDIKPAHMLTAWILVVVVGGMCGLFVDQYLISTKMPFTTAALSGFVTGLWVWVAMTARVRRYQRAIDRELPFVLDMMTLSVESGLSLQSALQQVERYGPTGVLQKELQQVLLGIRSGQPRVQAFRALSDRCGSSAVQAWVSAMVQSDQLGMSLGLMFREYANQSRTERIQKAEKQAMEASVKMLLPLIGCIFPCTFIVLAFPIVAHMLEGVL
jgi:tight adherence protein C